MTITDSIVADNARGGVGIGGPGGLTIDHSVISGNTGRYGAGVTVYQDYGGTTVSITDSTISGNHATEGPGGGIFVEGAALRLRGTTVSGNDATEGGGGIYLRQASSIANSTIVGNTATGSGGGIAAADDGGTTISNTTITGNTAAEGAGLATMEEATVNLKNSIVVGNKGPNISGPIDEVVASILGLTAGLTVGDILDPAGLADHGGPTRTIALTDSAANPAVDHGDAATCAGAAVVGLDQRGLPRTPPCDIGAYELQP